MATRRATNQSKSDLKVHLRLQCSGGHLSSGEMVPTLRELASEFGISKDVVSQSLRELVEEGLLFVVPRVGTFVGGPQPSSPEFYLMLLPLDLGVMPSRDVALIRNGFERRLASRGAASLAMPLPNALEARRAAQLPPLAGVFDFAFQAGGQTEAKTAGGATWGEMSGLARVGFHGRIEPGVFSDVVAYDSVAGGALATRHLLGLGHRHIGFLALHPRQNEAELETEFIWSRERESGWRLALEEADLPALSVAHPAREPKHTPQGLVEAARETAARLMQFSSFEAPLTAIVAANDYAAQGLFEALRGGGWPTAKWPAVVGFDNLSQLNGHLLSSLSLPGEQIGAAAADLLWERRHGLLDASAQTRCVPMQLIPRLTSRANWSSLAAHADLVSPL